MNDQRQQLPPHLAPGGVMPMPGPIIQTPRHAGPSPVEHAIVKRGEAIAHVRALEEKCVVLERDRNQIERDLHRAEDRITLLSEERTRYRRDADLYRTMLTELAGDMNAVALLMQRAQTTHERVLVVLNSATPPDKEETQDRGESTAANQTNNESQAIRRLAEIAEGATGAVATVPGKTSSTGAGTGGLAPPLPQEGGKTEPPSPSVPRR